MNATAGSLRSRLEGVGQNAEAGNQLRARPQGFAPPSIAFLSFHFSPSLFFFLFLFRPSLMSIGAHSLH